MTPDPDDGVDWDFDDDAELDSDGTAPPTPAEPPAAAKSPTKKSPGPLTASDFPSYFEALWGYPPFDWQTRLLKQVRQDGWPSTLDLPTGSGKTAALDIALFALALDALEEPTKRRQPRRIALVIDRRVVVDQAYERAATIAQKLDEAADGVLANVAGALRALAGSDDSLPVLPAILRGGMPRETEWAKTPSQPTILVSTVDQVGSRLLFRGYGVSDRMKPVHAGLLGQDTLYLLDEVHLARPFEETLHAIDEYYSSSQQLTQLRPLRFVRMSATVAERPEDTFKLADSDRSHELLRQRLSAKKLALLRQVKTPKDPAAARQKLATAAVREAERLAKGPLRALGVIVNRVDTARQIATLALERLGKAWDVQLLTGRMRPLDRQERQVGLIERIRAGRIRSEAAERVLVISTQAIEAGADFDFDALITECASLDALRQRFGRLDRLGELQSTDAVVLAASTDVDEKAEPDPIYGESQKSTWQWLQQVSEDSEQHDGQVVDFGIDALGSKLESLQPERLATLLAPRAVAPVLTASHLDRWAQTSPAPSADPEVTPFLHGMERGAPEVQLVWRADFDASHLDSKGLPFVRAALQLVPPSALEALSVPLWVATRWLSSVRERERAKLSDDKPSGDKLPVVPAVSDVEGEAPGQAERDQAKGMAPAVVWRSDGTLVVDAVDDVRPGDTLVVPSDYGGLDVRFACWDPEAVQPVLDRGDQAQLLQRGRALLRWNPAVIAGWGRELASPLRAGPQLSKEDVDDQGVRAERRAFQAWRNAVSSDPGAPQWVRTALSALGRGDAISRHDAPGRDHEEPLPWRVSWRPKRVPIEALQGLLGLRSVRRVTAAQLLGSAAATEDDEGSFLGSRVSLTRHLGGVRHFADKFGEALALSEPLRQDLALAGWLHDLGKADPRFQLMLHGGDPVREAVADELLAKSDVPATDSEARERARVRAGYPKGMRHELMSVGLVQHDVQLQKRAHDWDLVLHLVASHHGWCRPFPPPVLDPEPVDVQVGVDGRTLTASSDHQLSLVSSGIADRYWQLTRRYGWWTLAWLEAILRLADHRESEKETQAEDKND